MDLMSDIFEQKWLRKYRLMNKYYMVAVEATGVMSFEHRHCEHCLTKTSKKGVTTYFHYVLEAKLVTADGHCLPLCSEWLENPSGKFNKQDCEQKAFVRLAAKLKKQYPRLPLCILADGLYPNNTVFDICEKYDYKYILTLPDDNLRNVQDEVDLIRKRKPAKENYVAQSGYSYSFQYRYLNDICYQNHKINWFSSRQTKRPLPTFKNNARVDDTEIKNFEYVTNIDIEAGNIIEVAFSGRLRWKIENEGYNTQKNNGYELEHKYCRKSYWGLKNYYTLLLIAHAINQMMEKGKLVKSFFNEHSKETIKNIWSNLKAYMIFGFSLDDSTKAAPT